MRKQQRAPGTEANTKWGGTLALCCCITPPWCFYCLVSSEKTSPSVASAAEGGTNLLRACLEDADVPLMVCATGMVFKASAGLLKSVSSPFESFAVTESIREIWPDQELRA